MEFAFAKGYLDLNLQINTLLIVKVLISHTHKNLLFSTISKKQIAKPFPPFRFCEWDIHDFPENLLLNLSGMSR